MSDNSDLNDDPTIEFTVDDIPEDAVYEWLYGESLWPDVIVFPEPRCPRCGETAASHGNYASGEDWTCPDQDGYGKDKT